MRFSPKSKEEIAAERGVLKAGEGEFIVTEALETTSKSGNEMMKLKLKVWDSEGREGMVFDYLINNVHWKLYNFFESIGNLEAYEAGVLDPLVLIGAAGKCKLGIQKDATGKYGDQTKIVDYLKPGSEPTKHKNLLDEEEDDPFK